MRQNITAPQRCLLAITQSDWLVNGEPLGERVVVAGNIASFNDNWGVPGLVISYSDPLTATPSLAETVDLFERSTVCTAAATLVR